MALKPLPTDQSAFTTTDGKPSTVFYTWLKSLAEVFNTLLNTFFVGGTTSFAWTAYTPTVTSGTGTITASTATARSYQIGKLVFFQFEITITNHGTGAGNLLVTLPVPPAAFNYSFAGFETVDGVAIAGTIETADQLAHMTRYDGATTVFTTANVFASGVYEAA